jgi:tetratricopeptide (TPR) repeat protein
MLKVAPDEHSAEAVEGAIQGQWVGAATPAVKLLLLRGLQSINEDHPQDALDDLDAALDLQPDLIEAWRGRALARARLGDTKGAEHDIAETIKREPRQFEALEDLSHIAEQAGDWKGAYEAWGQVMVLDPKTPGGADRLKDLKRRAFGDET